MRPAGGSREALERRLQGPKQAEARPEGELARERSEGQAGELGNGRRSRRNICPTRIRPDSYRAAGRAPVQVEINPAVASNGSNFIVTEDVPERTVSTEALLSVPRASTISPIKDDSQVLIRVSFAYVMQVARATRNL